MGIPDHLTYLLRNLYAGQEASVISGHGTTDWFQIGKRVCQSCILSSCLFNLYEESVSSVSQFSRSVVSSSLRPHESQHARPPCPSPSPGVQSDSHPSSPWCHPAISSCVVPFFSCPQSLSASESFPMSQLFAWGGKSTSCEMLDWMKHKLQSRLPGEISITLDIQMTPHLRQKVKRN